MKHVSLRAGDTSLLHLILHFRTGTHYYVKLMLHFMENGSPSREGCTSFRDTLHLLDKNVIFCNGSWKGSCNYLNDIKVQMCTLIPEFCVLAF